MKPLGILVYCFFVFSLRAQSSNQDLEALLKTYYQLPNDSIQTKTALLETIARGQFNLFSDDSKWVYLDTLIQFYWSQKDTFHAIKTTYYTKGLAYHKWSNAPAALRLYHKYAEYLKSTRQEENAGYFYIDVGNVYYQLELYSLANQYYKKAEIAFGRQHIYEGLATTYNNYALVAGKQHQQDSAIYYIKKTLALFQQKLPNPYFAAHTQWTLSFLLAKQGKYKEARDSCFNAYPIFRDSNFIKYDGYMGLNYHPFRVSLQIAALYNQSNMLDSALYYIEDAKIQLKKHHLFLGWEMADLEKATVYTKQQRFKEAIALCEYILQQHEQHELSLHQKVQLEVLEQLQKIYTAMGNKAKMYEYGFRFYQLKDSVEQHKRTDKLLVTNNVVMQMENDKKIEAQQAEIIYHQQQVAAEQRDKHLLFVITILVIVILLFSIAFLIQLRKKNKLILQYTQQLEQSNTTKEILLSVIGHDLRAPFNSIFKSLQLAEIQHQNNEYLQSIQQSSRHAFAMLDSLLQWVSIQKEDLKPQLTVVPIQSLLNTILKPLDNLAILNNLKITSHIQVESIQTDQDMLHVILRNLVFNAIKYSPAQSTILIQTFQQNGQAYLTIYNKTNQVLDTDLLNKEHNFRTIAQKGSGLGLVLVKEFAERLGIQFTIQMVEDTGILCTLKFDTATVFFANNTAQEFYSIQNILQFDDAEHQYLQAIIQKIQSHQLYEGTAIKTILEEIPPTSSSLVQHWKQQILQAIYQLNEPLFTRLINLKP